MYVLTLLIRFGDISFLTTESVKDELFLISVPRPTGHAVKE